MTRRPSRRTRGSSRARRRNLKNLFRVSARAWIAAALPRKRSRWAPAAADGGLVDVAPALGGRAVLEPWPPPARSTCSAASKTVRVALCCQVSAEAGAVSLIPSRLSSDGCVFGDRCWCGVQRTRSRHDTPRPRARRSHARVTWAWVLMTLRGGLGKQTKLSSAGSSSEWWSQRTVPVRVVVTHAAASCAGRPTPASQ